MPLTRTPGASSRASARVSIASPAFAVRVDRMPGKRTLRVDVDHVHDQALRSRSCGAARLRQEQRRAQIGAHQIVPAHAAKSAPSGVG